MNEKPLKSGSAYALIKCSDHRPRQVVLDRFKEALENIKRAGEETKIPPRTEFAVSWIERWPEIFDFKTSVRGGPETDDKVLTNMIGIWIVVSELSEKGANLMIRSQLPNTPHAVVASDLGDCMNYLYSGTELFDAENTGREKIVMDIFYKDGNGIYVSKLMADLEEIRLGKAK